MASEKLYRDTLSILPFWTLRAAKDERHLLSCLTTVHYSPIAFSWDPIIAGFMEKFLRIKPENEGGNLFSFDAAIADGWVEPQLLWCRKLPVLMYNICFFSALGFSLFIFGLLQERVIVALLRRLHRSRWGNLYLCGLWHWRYILNLQSLLSSACWLFFSCTMIRKLFSHFL